MHTYIHIYTVYTYTFEHIHVYIHIYICHVFMLSHRLKALASLITSGDIWSERCSLFVSQSQPLMGEVCCSRSGF